jgi:hypothetical protein
MIFLTQLVLFAIVAATVTRVFRRLVYRSGYRTIFDTIPFLIEVDYDQLEALLDEMEEKNLRAHLGKREFRKAQQKRMKLLLVLLRWMAANAQFLVELGRNDERRGVRAGEPEWRQLGAELTGTATKFWEGAFFVRLTVHVWLIKSVFLPFSETANLSSLRNPGGFDLFEGYQKMVDAALNLGQAYGDDIHQKLVEAL